jgi:hypothetical protein
MKGLNLQYLTVLKNTRSPKLLVLAQHDEPPMITFRCLLKLRVSLMMMMHLRLTQRAPSPA